jgi:hypothetical protein
MTHALLDGITTHCIKEGAGPVLMSASRGFDSTIDSGRFGRPRLRP